MKILGIDPGNELSAWVLYCTEQDLPLRWGKVENAVLLQEMDQELAWQADRLVIEMPQSFGMAVGQTIFNTCVWVGRFDQWWRERSDLEPLLVFRKDAKHHICGNSKAGDSNMRQAIIDRYGPGKEKAIGVKANPGPLYKMTADVWQAFATALTAAETRLGVELAHNHPMP